MDFFDLTIGIGEKDNDGVGHWVWIVQGGTCPPL
jgi:hypothetical protein